MKISLDNFMMIIFIFLFIVSMWKIYAFLPSKVLEDDDSTDEAQDKLVNLILKNIKSADASPTIKELLEKIKNDKEFDEKLFWRLNENKLEHALQKHFLQHSNLNSIEDIYNIT